MENNLSSAEENDEDSSVDELSMMELPKQATPKQATPKHSNKKRTIDQRSPQNQQQQLVQDSSAPVQKARWSYCISQGIAAFCEALKLVEGQNSVVEEATRDLLVQAQAVQKGKAESALAATKELAKEFQALRQHVLQATQANANTNANTNANAIPSQQAKKSYAEATKPAASHLGRSTHVGLASS